MELSIGMPQSEHQPWTGVITRSTDDDAIDCAAAFDFDPVTRTGQVAPMPGVSARARGLLGRMSA
jgi:hypothetical protein